MSISKIVLAFIILLTLNLQFLSAQATQFAIIADPLIGEKNSETILKNIVDNINNRNDLDFVIVFGNISTDGTYAKLNSADNILSKIKIPYYVAPGSNDISEAINGGIDYLQSIGGDGFSFSYSSAIFISINPSLPFNTELKRFSVNEKRWVSDFKASSGNNKLFLFTPVTPVEIQNRNDLLIALNNVEYPFILSSDTDKYSREKFEGIELLKLPSLNEKQTGYNAIRIENDSIYIFSRQLADKSDLLIDVIPFKPVSIQSEFEKTATIYESSVIIRKTINLKELHLAGVLSNEGSVYTASKDGVITCFDDKGNKKWDYFAMGTMFHSPVRHKDVLTAVIFEGDLITLNANNGDVLQVMGMGKNITNAPALIDIEHNGYETKGIIITTLSGEIFCYELFSLELVWSHKLNKGRITAMPLQIKNILIFNNWNGEVFALNSNSGTIIWRYKIPGATGTTKTFSSPLSFEQNVFVLYGDDIIVSIDLLQGTQKWINSKIPHQHSFAIKPDSQIIVKGNDNSFIILSNADGKIFKKITSPGNNYFPNNIVVSEEYLLNGTSEGDILLIDNNFSSIKILNSFDAPIISISEVKPGTFVSLDIDGNLIFFDIKQIRK
ncbi:MAG TPA: PQQ-binding-like beta-propeller repeat protein [Ignavibacteriaceae bacterium]|nr:PQQ-binding-like beta-propeller repeat protein [Ignavibacteriaceae bacterium]